LLVDHGYDSDDFRDNFNGKRIRAVIPGKKDRLQSIEYDRHIYKERNAIKGFFGRLKEYQRIATKYGKTIVIFKPGIVIAYILCGLNFEDMPR
jgi:transposase